MLFWKIINNCEPECLFLDLLTQGFHHECQKTAYLKQNNIAEIGRFSFENRLNNVLCLLGDNWLGLCQVSVKRILKDIILQNIPAKYVYIFMFKIQNVHFLKVLFTFVIGNFQHIFSYFFVSHIVLYIVSNNMMI
jgi:hypothetical protein